MGPHAAPRRVIRLIEGHCVRCGHTERRPSHGLAQVALDGSWQPLELGGARSDGGPLSQSLRQLRREDRLLTVTAMRCAGCGTACDQFGVRPRTGNVGCLLLLVGPALALTTPLPLMPALAIALVIAWAVWPRVRRHEAARMAARWPDLPLPAHCPACDDPRLLRQGTQPESRWFPCPSCGARSLSHRVRSLREP